MHVQRLADDFVELDAHVPDRLAAAGVDPADAAAAGAFLYTVGADGSATLAPWPLGVPEVTETEHLELGQLHEDAVPAHPLAAVGPDHDAVHCSRVSHTNVRSCRKEV